MNPEIWTPSEERIKKSALFTFQKKIENKYGQKFQNFLGLHQWSIDYKEDFWCEIMAFFSVSYEGDLTPVLSEDSFESYGWFKNVSLNFAENLLKFKDSQESAVNYIHELGNSIQYSHKDLYHMSASLQKVLKKSIGPGDVVGAYMPNIPHTLISMLATTSLGGVFTSTSCDFGVSGVVDRFSQSAPKVLIAATGYTYNGKYFDQREKIKKIVESLSGVDQVILVDFLNRVDGDGAGIKDGIFWHDIVEFNHHEEMSFTKVPFAAPLYIMYSSGTTGKPKCIIHSVGGTLLQHLKELGLQTDHNKEKSLFYFTTCGWMMWNWLMSSLALGGEIILYEGSPGYPHIKSFFKMIARESIHIFGTSPKFLKALEDAGWDHDLEFPSLEGLLSTGAPLLPEQFDFIYKNIKKDISVSSICGGTDIIGCFMAGNPLLPVRRGEISGPALGMAVECFNEAGERIFDREGELVCVQTFPSRPLGFLNDPGDKKLKQAYFSKFPGVWHHGDFINISAAGGICVFGRSDTTLNPGGVRIGTAEIYRQTELLSFVEDSLCVGKKGPEDVEIFLFVTMQEGEELTEGRKVEIKKAIRRGATSRHIPRDIIQVEGIPYTRSGKKMELVVARLINGRSVDHLEAVANPECLASYKAWCLLKNNQ